MEHHQGPDRDLTSQDQDFLDRALTPGTSFTRFLLQDPVAHARIVNWVDFAEWAIAALRRETSRLPGDRALHALVTDLRRDPQVDAWWRDHRIRDFVPTRKQIDHPQAGRLSFQVELLIAPHDPHQRMVVYTVQPGPGVVCLRTVHIHVSRSMSPARTPGYLYGCQSAGWRPDGVQPLSRPGQ